MNKILTLFLVRKEIRDKIITKQDLWKFNNLYQYDFYGIKTLTKYEKKYLTL